MQNTTIPRKLNEDEANFAGRCRALDVVVHVKCAHFGDPARAYYVTRRDVHERSNRCGTDAQRARETLSRMERHAATMPSHLRDEGAVDRQRALVAHYESEVGRLEQQLAADDHVPRTWSAIERYLMTATTDAVNGAVARARETLTTLRLPSDQPRLIKRSDAIRDTELPACATERARIEAHVRPGADVEATAFAQIDGAATTYAATLDFALEATFSHNSEAATLGIGRVPAGGLFLPRGNTEHVQAFLCFHLGDAMKAKIRERIAAKGAERSQLSVEERAARLRAVEERVWRLGVEEEAIVCLLEQGGAPQARRADADPAILVAVPLNPSAAAAAA